MATKEASNKMKAKYLDKITKLLERTHPKLADTCRIAFKNCFGAVAGYVKAVSSFHAESLGSHLGSLQKRLKTYSKKRVYGI